MCYISVDNYPLTYACWWLLVDSVWDVSGWGHVLYIWITILYPPTLLTQSDVFQGPVGPCAISLDNCPRTCACGWLDVDSVWNVPGGCGAMYQISIEAEEFRGKKTVLQHRLVNEVNIMQTAVNVVPQEYFTPFDCWRTDQCNYVSGSELMLHAMLRSIQTFC